ncbi:MAG: hypothetical protein U0527_03795 [Candidatus Eisenbacteria bacterium]
MNAPAASTRTFASESGPLLEFDASSEGQPRARWVAADCRLLRRGHAPFLGLTACERELGPLRAVSTTPVRALVAESGELGATWGSYTSGTESGGYLRVWRRAEAGDWMLVAESMQAAE